MGLGALIKWPQVPFCLFALPVTGRLVDEDTPLVNNSAQLVTSFFEIRSSNFLLNPHT